MVQTAATTSASATSTASGVTVREIMGTVGRDMLRVQVVTEATGMLWARVVIM